MLQPSRLDDVVTRTKEGSRAFAKLSVEARRALLDDIRARYLGLSEAMVRAACEFKGLEFGSPVSGEEWLNGPLVTVRLMRLLSETLGEIARYGTRRFDRSLMRRLPDGRLALKVFPLNGLERVLLAGHEAEAHFLPGVTEENLREHVARFYQAPHDGRLCLVLGGGNVNAIPALDLLTKMFIEGKACVLKMNPVNAYLAPLFEKAFAPAIERGFLAVLSGGAEEGAALVRHPLVDEVHITGSERTYDSMVWGKPGPEREERKRRKEPLLQKPVSSELGNITPVIVVPGPYSPADLAYVGRNLAGMLANNAGFNCNAPRLLVTSKRWEQRQALLDSIERGLGRAEIRRAYYPGAEEAWHRFTANRPELRVVGQAKPGSPAYGLLWGVDATKDGERAFVEEPWCTVLSETALELDADPVAFLDEAVRFVNERVWGTLCAILIVHPETERKTPGFAAALEQAISQLRYGAVCVNTWPGAVFGLGSTPWGGHPSATPEDIQSGTGWVHNGYMLETVEKAVLRAPVRTLPIALWSPGHRTLDVLAPRLVRYEAAPSWLKVPGLAAAGLTA